MVSVLVSNVTPPVIPHLAVQAAVGAGHPAVVHPGQVVPGVQAGGAQPLPPLPEPGARPEGVGVRAGVGGAGQPPAPVIGRPGQAEAGL